MRSIMVGDTVKDTVSGIVGVVVSKCEHLRGTTQLAVQPAATDACPVPDSRWFEEGRCELVKAAS